MKKIISAVLLISAVSSNATNVSSNAKPDTLCVTTTPIMHCDKCENKIKSNIRFVKGTKDIKTSVPEQKVTIIYDGKKSTYTDYEKAFKKIGYDIRKK